MRGKEEDLTKYGEPITYDRSFKGPLEKRSCTDVICLLIFIVFLAAWGFVAYYAYSNGDLNKLLVPTDTQNQKCGLDSRVIDKPYLFFFNLEKCIDPLTPISGCPTPQVCVKECPKETFVLNSFQGSLTEIKSKMICQSENDILQIGNKADAQRLVEANRCAGWYVKSKPFLNRCVWEFSSQLCEYIPPKLIRSRRDLSLNRSETFKNGLINNRLDVIQTPVSAMMIDNFDAKSTSEIIPNDQLQSYNQRKEVEEPKIECKYRKQLDEQVIMEKMKVTDTYLGRYIGNFVAHFYNGTDAQEFGQKLVEDIQNSWGTILVSLILAMVVSLLFIAIMRWLAGPVLWFSIIGALIGLGYGIYFTVTQYMYYKDHETVPYHSPNIKAAVKTLFEDKNTWLVLAIILSVTFLIIFLMVIFLRKRIVIAIALVKEGSKAVSSITSSVFFPILPWVLQVATIGLAVIIGLYLASVGDRAFKIVGDMAKCSCSGPAQSYQQGSKCVPQIFNDHCFSTEPISYYRASSTKTPCLDSGCHFEKLDTPKLVGYFHAYNVIGFFWLVFFISAFGDMVLAATFATWYWTFHKSDVPYFTLTRAFGRTIRYHLGTLAFGALIITICRLIRLLLEYIDAKLKKYDNGCTRAILCCMKCFFWCLETFLRFLNKNAYIMCAIHGKNFCVSAKDAFNLLMRNCLRVVTLDKVTDFLFFLSKILITAAAGAGTYYFVAHFEQEHQLHYNVVPTVIVVIGTYLITTVFFDVYSMAVDTLFLCFLEDSERNDGSAEKPYYMSKQLMKILGTSNEVPRHQYR